MSCTASTTSGDADNKSSTQDLSDAVPTYVGMVGFGPDLSADSVKQLIGQFFKSPDLLKFHVIGTKGGTMAVSFEYRGENTTGNRVPSRHITLPI
jgi:hypothetical protein